MKSQGDISFPTDGHKATLNKLNSKSKKNRKRTSGWLGRAMVLGSFKCRGVQLLWPMEGQGPAVLSAGAGSVGCFFVCLFVFFFFFFFFFFCFLLLFFFLSLVYPIFRF